jgi:hypothetical protein
MSDEKKPGADFDLDDETLAALADDRDDAVAAIRRRLEEGWSLDGAILLHGTRELRNSLARGDHESVWRRLSQEVPRNR